MQRLRDFLKLTVVAFALLTLPSAAWAAEWRTLSITVVNSTTTPAPAGQTHLGAGFLPVSCDGRAFQPVREDQTVTVNCSVRGDESLTLTYSVHLGDGQLHYGTADIDCQNTAELTFTGSGTAVTFTKSCTDTDTSGDDTSGGGDGDSGDGGDSGGDGDSGGGGDSGDS